MNNSYLAGFFDADGHLGFKAGYSGEQGGGIIIQITQKDRARLVKIRNFLGYGTISPQREYWCLGISGRANKRDFIDRIRYHSCLKAKIKEADRRMTHWRHE